MITTSVVVSPDPLEPALAESPAPPAKEPMPVDKLVEKYIALRDRKEALDKKHKAELAPYRNAMEQIEALLLGHLNDSKLESMRAHTGTAYKTIRTSAKVVGWSEVLDFIREKECWELLEARVSKVAAEALVAERQAAIPGVEITREVCVQVRRGS
jgi:hypothetical protein